MDGFSIVYEGSVVRISTEASIDVYNLAGMKVMSGYGNELDLSSLNSGLYIVTATTPAVSRTLKIAR